MNINQTAIVEQGAYIGQGSSVWHFAHIRENAKVGDNCNIGKGVYIDSGVQVGNGCKLQNNVSIYRGVTLEDFVFCGPSMTFTNVRAPRCLYPTPQENYLETVVGYGASLGAGSVVVCGVSIGRHAMVGAGAVVTKNVPDFALIVGNPARQRGWVCRCGCTLPESKICQRCSAEYVLIGKELMEVQKDEQA